VTVSNSSEAVLKAEDIMRIGVPTEIKSNEFRVGLVPGSVRELTAREHDVVVQSGAGAGIFADDADYEKAGARILPTAEAVFAEAEMIVRSRSLRRSSIAGSSRTRFSSPIFTSHRIRSRPAA
jgi:NAD/NADP transhydrogenase alpha subunit